MRPERDALEIRFPRVAGYRVELPEERLTARFTDESTLVLTPDLVGPTITRNAGIIGEAVDLSLDHLEDTRVVRFERVAGTPAFFRLEVANVRSAAARRWRRDANRRGHVNFTGRGAGREYGFYD